MSGLTGGPEYSKSISAMAASLLAEACGVADILEGQLLLLKPLMAVHGTQRLLTGSNQVLVLPLACKLKCCFSGDNTPD